MQREVRPARVDGVLDAAPGVHHLLAGGVALVEQVSKAGGADQHSRRDTTTARRGP